MKQTLIKIERIGARLHKMLIDWRGASRQVYFEHRVQEYGEMWRAIADNIGAQFRTLTSDLWELELDGNITRVHNYQLEFDDPVTLSLAGKKPLVHKLLKKAGIPVPDYTVFHLWELDKACDFLSRHPEGCVIKPADGYAGKGVTTHVLTKREVRKAAILSSLYSQDILIERQIPGESYRILVIKGKMAHAVCRRGPRLKGDGASTVSDLISKENVLLKNKKMRILDVDRDCIFTLRYQNLFLNSIPDKDRVFLVKSIDDPIRKQVEVRTVYNETVTDLICDSVRRQVELAASIVSSDFLGVDVITTNPAISLEESGGVVNEVNTTPALHHHYDNRVEKYPQVAVHAITLLLQKNKLSPK